MEQQRVRQLQRSLTTTLSTTGLRRRNLAKTEYVSAIYRASFFMYPLCMLGSHKDHRRAQSGALLATYGLHRAIPQLQRTRWEITYRNAVVGVDVSAILVS